MDLTALLHDNGSKIILFVWDGVGGVQAGPDTLTELQAARTPNADRLVAAGCCGLLEPVYPGVTPGSGPGHLGLFGYDPVAFQIGRGALEAAGVGFDLRPGDVAARLNFCTLDSGGNICDRRAGRLPDAECRRVVAKLANAVGAVGGIEVHWTPVKEHRALLVLRGEGLGDGLEDTDPQQTGVPPLDVRVKDDSPRTARTAKAVRQVLARAREVLADETKANMVLARGFAERPTWPSVRERFGLRAAVVAGTPMYRGVARLVGMEALDATNDVAKDVASLAAAWNDFDFFFIHYKHTDKAGEDGDFEAKVKCIEEADAALPALEALRPDVLTVTADHSTPSAMKAHSWHPVPVLLSAATARRDAVTAFDEVACIQGGLGLRPSTHLMPLALAHAGRLAKFGA
ncbi:MAG: phosphoglycerate mutase [Planctomycetes bacterium SM23_25]|nr:MAG: phosphoglycerate mutase [Planctomycetes bacterium SM23_25]